MNAAQPDRLAMVPCVELPCQGDLILFDSPAPLRKLSLPVVRQEDLLEAVSTSPPISHVTSSHQEHTSQTSQTTVHKTAILYEISELRHEIRQYREEHQRKFYSANSYSENVEIRRETCSEREQLRLNEEHSALKSEDDDIVELDSIFLLETCSSQDDRREEDVLITLGDDSSIRSTLRSQINKTPPISTISELDEEDTIGFENEEVSEPKKTDSSQDNQDQEQSVSPLAFRYEDCRDSSGRVFVLDAEVEEWIDGPFEDEESPQSSDCSADHQNETKETLDGEQWIYESLNISEPCGKQTIDEYQKGPKEIENRKENRSKSKKMVTFSTFENGKEELVTSLDSPDDDYSPSQIRPSAKTKSLLKKGPCSGSRVTFNVNMTVFSEECPEGESVALRVPPDMSRNDTSGPPSNVMCFVNDDFIQSHWLDIMMNDSSFLNKNEDPQPLEIDDNLPQFEEIDQKEESMSDMPISEPASPKQNVINENNSSDNTEDDLEEVKPEESKPPETNNIDNSDSQKEAPEIEVSKEPKSEISFSENDFLDHVRLSKQCQLSPEEFKDLSTQHRSNNEVRHSIEMSALRRSLIRGADIRKKTKERPKSASIGEMSLVDKLRMLTQDCNDNTEDQEERDELELFVQQNVPRIEKIKKRYSLTEEDPTYGFARLPSVRGIRPKYGTTTEILKQLQNQIQPHPLASQVGPLSWPYVPEAHLQRPPPQTEVHRIPANGIERSALSYSDIKLRPKRGREGLQKSISAQFPTKEEERGTPEGASSSPKILMDGWAPYCEAYGTLKRNSLPNYNMSRSGYIYPPSSLQPVYETPQAYYHQNGVSYKNGPVTQNGAIHQIGTIQRNSAVLHNGAIPQNGPINQNGTIQRNDMAHQNGSIQQNGKIQRNDSVHLNGPINQKGTLQRNGPLHQNSTIHPNVLIHQNGTIQRNLPIHQNGTIQRNFPIHQNGTSQRSGAIQQNGTLQRNGLIQQSVPIQQNGPIHHIGPIHQHSYRPSRINSYGPQPQPFGRMPPPYPQQTHPPNQHQNTKDPGLIYYTMSV